MTSVPLSDLKLYPNWKDAPLGAIVAYGSPIFVTVPPQQPTMHQGPKIALRAQSSAGLQQFLVVVTPEPMLASQVNERSQPAIFAAVEASDGPAVDVTAQYDLRIEPAPIVADLYTDPPMLTVVQTMGEKPQTLLFAGNIGRSARYLVLDGDEKGALLERPPQRAIIVGKLLIVPKSVVPTVTVGAAS